MTSSDLPDRARQALAQTLQAIEQNPDDYPAWEDAADLGRLSIQAHQRQLRGGFEEEQPRGSLRLSGEGVAGHSVPLAKAGQLMQQWQTLVAAAGASIEGHKTIQGRLPKALGERTELALMAAPGAGSVMLDFGPVAPVVDERYPDGATRLGGDSEPLVERAVEAAFTVLEVAASDDVDGTETDAVLTELGPRVASAARNLANSSATSSIDLTFRWDIPGKARRKVAVTSSQAATFVSVLTGHHLETEIVSLDGVLHTVSDQRRIDFKTVDPEDGEVVFLSVTRGDVDFTGFALHDVVRLTVELGLRPRPGREDLRTYKAISIARLDPGEGSWPPGQVGQEDVDLS